MSELLQLDVAAVALILFISIFSVYANKMDMSGAIVGGLIALCLYAGCGFHALWLLVVFFILGNVASQWKLQKKIQLGLAQADKGKRSIRHAVANGGVAGLCGFMAWLWPEYRELLNALLAASLASATADTLSSELGNVYGRHYWNIVTCKKDVRGLDGVISLEGSLFGSAGSCLIALFYGLGTDFSSSVIWVAIAGIVGNLADSILGATVQRQGYLNNDAVNFVNTLVAALVMLIFLKYC